jgi:hypothetical protein
MSNYTVNPDGSININIENIKKISIDHITEVLTHRIMRSGDLTIHDLEFIKNGKCYLAYTKEGKIVDCRIANMNTEVNFQEGVLILKVPPNQTII